MHLVQCKLHRHGCAVAVAEINFASKSRTAMCVYCVEVSAGPHEDRLIKRIFYDNHYYQSSRPVLNESSAIEVKFGLSLQQIIDVVSLGQLKHSVR